MAAASESRVLRFFGVKEEQVRQAASALAGRCALTGIETRAQGAETLLALTASPAALRKAEDLLGRTFRAGLYGAGEQTLADCAARALVKHDRLLACADALALDLLAPRLEGKPGIDACFDFGAGSCADPAALAKIEAGARRCRGGGPAEPVWDELCRLRAALRVTHADLVAGAIPLQDGTLAALAGRRGCWLCRVPAGDNPALWLLDMIRRAAAGSAQAAQVSFTLHGERPALSAVHPPLQLPAAPAAPALETALAPAQDAGAAPDSAALPRRSRWPARLAFLLLVLAAVGLAAAFRLTGGDLAALPEVLRTLPGGPDLPAHSGATLL